jgi:protein TonB
MEQPTHDLRVHGTTVAQASPARFIAGAAAIGLQALLVFALAAGLIPQAVLKLPEEIKAEVVQEKIPDKIPPPPPPDLAKPPPPFVPPPDINIQNEAPATTAITTQSKVATPAPAPVAQISSPASIGRPHQCQQDYPAISQRLNEEGVTTLAFHIMTDGSISNITVAKSSGHDRLDQAAVSCAQSWRYKPATQNGQPVEVPWQTNVQWRLQQ